MLSHVCRKVFTQHKVIQRSYNASRRQPLHKYLQTQSTDSDIVNTLVFLIKYCSDLPTEEVDCSATFYGRIHNLKAVQAVCQVLWFKVSYTV